MESEDLKEALLALADMVAQHCREDKEKSKDGATVILEPCLSSDEEAIAVLLGHGYMRPISSWQYAFTEKVDVWGPWRT